MKLLQARQTAVTLARGNWLFPLRSTTGFFVRVRSFYVPLVIACLCLGVSPEATAQPTSFTYQGRLVDNGAVANGWYDLRFLLYPVANTGGPMGTNAMAVYVSGGLFSVSLDFGSAAFSGPDPISSSWDRWLEIGVRTNGS